MNSHAKDKQTAPGVIGAARIYLTIIVGLVLLFSGCKSPFATREADPPSTGQSQILEPTSAENVLRNLHVSLKEARNVDDYMNTLSEDFLFVPDETDRNSFSDVFTTPWDRNREAEFCRILFDKASFVKFYSSIDSNAVVEEETAEFIHYRYEYDIGIIHSTDAPSRMQGIADFYLNSNSQGDWTIFKWEDENTGAHSWGELRARF